MKEEMFPHPGNPLTDWDISWDRQRASEAQRGVHQPARGRQKKASTDDPCHLTAFPRPRCMSAGAQADWVLKLELQKADPGSGLQLAAWRQTEGTEVWYVPQLGVYTDRTRACHRSAIVNGYMKGRGRAPAIAA